MGNKVRHKKGWFVCFAQKIAQWAGSAYAFIIMLGVLIVWGFTGPLFDYSDTWQLVINTATSLVTFLMVFLIQNTQNRDSRAMQLKLDELIRASEGAHTALLNLEELSEEELRAFSEKYFKIAEVARNKLRSGKKDTDIPEIVFDAPLKP